MRCHLHALTRASCHQVEVAVEEYRDELEGAGGLSKQQVEDRVRVKRAQLTVEAERAAERCAGAAAAGAAAKDDGKSSSRCGPVGSLHVCDVG